jgi:hypothetical protein
VRLWEITLEGDTESVSLAADAEAVTIKKMSVTYSEELNGSIERSISGRMIILQNSSTPIKKAIIEATGTTARAPVSPGNSLSIPGIGSGLIVTSTSSRREAQINDYGVKKAVLYDYVINMEG